MFYCSFCKKNSRPGETSNKVVVEARDKVYLEPMNPNRKRTAWSFKEVVKELVSCSQCLGNVKIIEKVGNTFVRAGLV